MTGATRWAVVVLAALEAGWMAFDGVRALVVGDYVTPRSGPHAGQLGPWARLVAAVGVDPRSTAMKVFFAAYGILWLAAAALFAAGTPGLSWVMLALAAGSLWYLVPGTVLGLAQAVLLAIHLCA